MTQAKVTGLHIYPVKSCRGINLNELIINERGPQYDRQWMIVDDQNKFLTLRTLSKLAEIKTSIQGSFLHLYAGSNKILVNTTEPCDQVEEVTVHNDSLMAGVENKSINEALSDFLERSVKLVRYQKESFRELKEAATSSVKETMFADARPILLVNEASMRDLNSKLSEASSFERFRPNIIIDGLPAYAEDNIKEIKIGDVLFQNPKLCSRCSIVTQNVETGQVVSKETMKILSQERKKLQNNKVYFGVYLTPANTGVIHKGDSVSIAVL